MKIWLLIILLITISVSAKATSFYTAATASIAGDGSFLNPWPLQTALHQPAVLLPGDTVWLRGGIYTNTFDAQTSFSCYTHGTATAPILFRNFNNERATIDGEHLYSLYLGLGNCSYTWFWGIEVTNSYSIDRNHDIPGGVTCTAENMKFINMIVHDTGSGLDCWKTALNSEIYGCLIYNIGNNLNNNGNLEGHGHGMYLQNDTFGTKIIHNNIVFSNYGYGIKIWQTTTTSAIGNFDLQRNIVYNGGAASDNLGGIGNNSRTHNFFVVANGVDNPIVNTVIKHNYTYAGTNTPRPPVNAFGLNYGVKHMILDSNYLTCQTRLGFNNTPVFDASVKGNTILGGIPPVYGIYLWGFTQPDFPLNNYVPEIPASGVEYFVLPNTYETGRAHIVIYNWDSLATVQVDISVIGLNPGDQYELINAMDYYADTILDTYDASGIISVPMTGHSFAQVIGSTKSPVSQFPTFGAFVVRRKNTTTTTGTIDATIAQPFCISPNPSGGLFTITDDGTMTALEIFNVRGEKVFDKNDFSHQELLDVDLSSFPKGVYFLRKRNPFGFQTNRIIIQ